MDSKLRRRTIFTITLLIGILIGSVLFLNWEMLQRKIRTGQKRLNLQEEKKDTEVFGDIAVSLTKETGWGVQIGDHLHAFEGDETFFEPKLSAAERMLLNSGRDQLSLVVQSVEKDLRIQIVDGTGEIVPDEGFLISLKSGENKKKVGEYKDIDQDGVIYIADLISGDYYLQLEPIEGYHVPESDIYAFVKEQVEYVLIDDINLLIFSEDDINPLEEDTGILEAEEEGDKSEKTELQFDNGIPGIDVSKYQGDIDWYAVKDAGIDFTIIRCGYRGSKTGCLVEDPTFAKNLRQAKNAGVKVGLYFFTQAVTEIEAVEEASMALMLCEDYDLDLPIFIDTEGAGGSGRADSLEKAQRTTICEAFCSTVQNAGHQAGIYASCNWLNNNLDMDVLGRFEVWLAEYRDPPKYEGYYSMWQYTSKGSVPGIEGRVDLDIAYPK